MAKTAKGPIPLTEAVLIEEIVGRLDGEVSKATVRQVVKALKEEVADCLVNGYKVTLTGLCRFEPKYVAEKPKGEMVRNPATGEMMKRAKTVPATFRAKAYASSAIGKLFPTIKSANGQALAKALKK